MSSTPAPAPLPASLPQAQKHAAPAAPPAPVAPRKASAGPAKSFAITTGKKDGAQIVCIYGPGGIGKTTLASCAPSPVVIDLDHGADELDVPKISTVETLADFYAVLEMPEVKAFRSIVVDTVTRLEELVVGHVLANVKDERGNVCESLEGYGFGKGYVLLFEEFIRVLNALESIKRRGQNVIVVAHDCTSTVSNPNGTDYLRVEPRLYQSKTGNNSLRQRLKEVVDHLLYVSADVHVSSDKTKKIGKAVGGNSRTIHVSDSAAWMAKSRRLEDDISFDKGSDALWRMLFPTFYQS